MAQALRRDSHIHTGSTGRTSTSVYPRDPFPARRSTYGVRGWKAHSKISFTSSGIAEVSSVGPANILPPFCRERRKRKRDPLYVANRFLLVGRSAWCVCFKYHAHLTALHRIGRTHERERLRGSFIKWVLVRRPDLVVVSKKNIWQIVKSER